MLNFNCTFPGCIANASYETETIYLDYKTEQNDSKTKNALLMFFAVAIIIALLIFFIYTRIKITNKSRHHNTINYPHRRKCRHSSKTPKSRKQTSHLNSTKKDKHNAQQLECIPEEDETDFAELEVFGKAQSLDIILENEKNDSAKSAIFGKLQTPNIMLKEEKNDSAEYHNNMNDFNNSTNIGANTCVVDIHITSAINITNTKAS